MLTKASAVATTLLGGCVVPGPPELEEEPRVPPIINAFDVQPELRQVHEVRPNETIGFRVLVLSNPADGLLFAGLYRDYGYTTAERVDDQKPEPAAEGSHREIEFAHTFNEESDGCYPFTLLVTHLDNTDTGFQVVDEADVAMVTWWFSVDADEFPNQFHACVRGDGT